jgi:D-alanyl-lipoteichoic acid acyltransferase DltB (MBOAT superfamily)
MRPNQIDDAVPLASRRSLPSKCALLALSIALIWLIAGDWQILVFILTMVTSGWVVIAIGDRLLLRDRARAIAAGLSIAGAMAAIVGANVAGLLGTQTGTAETLQNQWPALLGITFYALQVAGVASDVFRRAIVRPALIDYLTFVLLGFKFYSGPLERATDLDRIVNHVDPRTTDVVWEGFSWVLLGVFMKFVIANPMAELIILDTDDPLSTLAVATVAELRIYFDFAGYSFMALGLARLAGIELTNNFRQPFFARNLRDFWHRWHASFGNWLRHYIYFPSRDAMRERRMPTRLLAPSIFMVSAIWHGGTVNFAMWGALHAFAFWIFVAVLSKGQWSALAAHGSIISLLIFARVLTIDADTERLFAKLAQFVDLGAWQAGIAVLSDVTASTFPKRAMFAIGLSLAFIVLELVSIRRFGTHDYRLFRTLPAMAVILVLTVLFVHHSPSAIFVYARN